MEFYLYAFYELATTRFRSDSQIPWTAIDSYAQRYDLRGEDFDVFRDLVRTMDRHCMSKGKKGKGVDGESEGV